MLISFESEVNNIREQYEAQGLKWYSENQHSAEFLAAWVDKNAGQPKKPKPILTALRSPAQTIITDYYYRVNNLEVMDKLKDKFRRPSCSAEDKFGSPGVMKNHFTSGGS